MDSENEINNDRAVEKFVENFKCSTGGENVPLDICQFMEGSLRYLLSMINQDNYIHKKYKSHKQKPEKLVLDNNILAYIKYLVQICVMAQSEEWDKVKKFDEDYRKHQAKHGCKWGETFSNFEDININQACSKDLPNGNSSSCSESVTSESNQNTTAPIKQESDISDENNSASEKESVTNMEISRHLDVLNASEVEKSNRAPIGTITVNQNDESTPEIDATFNLPVIEIASFPTDTSGLDANQKTPKKTGIYSCHICYLDVYTKQDFKEHMKKQHGIKSPYKSKSPKVSPRKLFRSPPKSSIGDESNINCQKSLPEIGDTEIKEEIDQNDYGEKSAYGSESDYIPLKKRRRLYSSPRKLARSGRKSYENQTEDSSQDDDEGSQVLDLRVVDNRMNQDDSSQDSSQKDGGNQSDPNVAGLASGKKDVHWKKKFCSECNQDFTTVNLFKIHETETHSKSSADNAFVRCGVCDEQFYNIYRLNQHVMTSELCKKGEKVFVCGFCAICCHQVAQLRLHIMRHMGEKPFKCDECPKSFVNIFKLNEHKVSHSDIRPYSCDVCKRRFKTKPTLKIHRRTHTPHANFACPMCEKTFPRKPYLRRHVESAHGDVNIDLDELQPNQGESMLESNSPKPDISASKDSDEETAETAKLNNRELQKYLNDSDLEQEEQLAADDYDEEEETCSQEDDGQSCSLDSSAVNDSGMSVEHSRKDSDSGKVRSLKTKRKTKKSGSKSRQSGAKKLKCFSCEECSEVFQTSDMPPVPKYKDILEEQQSGGTESQTKLDILPVPEYEDISEAEDVNSPQKQTVAAPTSMQKLDTLLQPCMLLERLQVDMKALEMEAAAQQEPPPAAAPPQSSATEPPAPEWTLTALHPVTEDGDPPETPLHPVIEGGDDPQQSDSEGEFPDSPVQETAETTESPAPEWTLTALHPVTEGGSDPPASPLHQQSDSKGGEPPDSPAQETAETSPQADSPAQEQADSPAAFRPRSITRNKPPRRAAALRIKQVTDDGEPQQSDSEGGELPDSPAQETADTLPQTADSPAQEQPAAASRALWVRSITRRAAAAAALRLKQELLDPSESEGEGFKGLEDEEDMEEQAYTQCKENLAAPRLLSRARDLGRRVMQAQAESKHRKHRAPRTKSGLPKPEKPWREVYMSVPAAGPQKCPLCFKLFPRRLRLLDHLRRTHFAEKDYGCSKCDKVFRSKQTLVKHINDAKCFNDKMVRCRMCGLRFECRSAWMAHYQKVHQTASPRPYSCPHCPKAYATRCGVKEHIRIVHDQTTVATYACDHCNKLFKALRDLKRHERVHTNERPYVCDICGKAFKQISALRKHGYIHMGKKPHECALCHQAFRQKAHLTKHMRCMHRGYEEGATTLRPTPEYAGQEEVPALDSTSRAETLDCQVSLQQQQQEDIAGCQSSGQSSVQQQQQSSGQCSSPQTEPQRATEH